MISTFLFIVKHSLRFDILYGILMVSPKVGFRSRCFLKIFGGKFMYSIGQVAEMFGLPISTLRYYDKQGLFPNMERVSGIRRFSNREIEALRVIECLKKAGMEIKDIRQFMIWCAEGPSTYPQRKAMFEERKAHMESEIAHMNRALDMLKFKCWYYEQAIKDGSEDAIPAMIPNDLPEDIRRAYENSHKE
jgi:transcriptional regulator, merR family